MATVYITLTGAMGGGAPVYATRSHSAQKITSSGSSQQAAFTAAGGEYLRVSSEGGSIAILISDNPTAVSGGAGSHFVMDGGTMDLGPMKSGDKLAIIDA